MSTGGTRWFVSDDPAIIFEPETGWTAPTTPRGGALRGYADIHVHLLAHLAHGKSVFAGKPVALIGASPGGFGTILSQNAWLPVLRTLGAELWTGGRLMVSRANKVFDADGTVIDQSINEMLRVYLEGFVAYVRAR